MNIKQRLEKLEAVAKIQTSKYAVTEIWLVPLGATSGAARWCYPSGEFVSVSDEELKNLKEDRKLDNQKSLVR